MTKDNSTPFPLILASGSPYRKELLKQLGYPFEVIIPDVDERQFLEQDPQNLALNISHAKAKKIFDQHSKSCVIGSDQVCAVDEMILHKPYSFKKAKEQLQILQGRFHKLFTAVTVISPQGVNSFLEITELKMRQLSSLEIDHYLHFDEPYDCCGSYKLESRGIKLFEHLQMSDHTAIVGLPLLKLTKTLLSLGFPL